MNRKTPKTKYIRKTNTMARENPAKKYRLERPEIFGTVESAAMSALNKANPLSIQRDREYCGYIYKRTNSVMRPYGYTRPLAGNSRQVTNEQSQAASRLIPENAYSVAHYHTHGAYDPNYDSNNFSANDRMSIAGNDGRNFSRYKQEVPEPPPFIGYLGTPSEAFKSYNPRNREQRVIKQSEANPQPLLERIPEAPEEIQRRRAMRL